MIRRAMAICLLVFGAAGSLAGANLSGPPNPSR